MVRNITSAFVAIIAFTCSSIVGADVVPSGVDLACFSDAQEKFQKCMASAESDQSARDECIKGLIEEWKKCRK